MDQFRPKHWYIIGAGAIGCLWACALRKAGYEVTLLVKSESNHDLATFGQTVEYIPLFNEKGNKRFTVEILEHKQLCREGRIISHLIIATKAQDALAALNPILSQLSHSAKVLCLSNGLGIHQALLAALKYQSKGESEHGNHKNRRQLLQGVSSDGARLDQPFKVKHTGKGHTYIGRYNTDKLSATDSSVQALQPLADLELVELFLGTSIVDNIEERIWQKALVNCVINPLTAFYRCTNGELFINSERKEKVHALCEELANIIKQTQCPISTTTAQIISDTKTIALLTEKNTSSMLTDLKNGRTLELEHLNRYFIRRAEQHAVPCPINLDLVNTLTKASK
ncbi:MAG: 2-dehydropantoate 2-reductase [Pseudomonadota bacterium]|nr:2-dehydropantoate 2-reductase [Pseudomonadota bacterium]